MISKLNIAQSKPKPEELSTFSNIAFEKFLKLLRMWYEPTGETLPKYLPDLQTVPDIVCLKIKDFVYKDYLQEKNSFGNALTEDDKKIAPEIVKLLYHTRNYYSHFLHVPTDLKLDGKLRAKLKALINTCFDKGNVLEKERDADVKQWQLQNPLFESDQITEQDAIFFVALFLMKSEGTKLIRYWLRKKMTSPSLTDKLVKILTYYCHRDGATRKFYNQKEASLFEQGIDQIEEVLAARTFYKINDYLSGVPPHIYNPQLYPFFIADKTPKRVVTKEEYQTFFQNLQKSIESKDTTAQTFSGHISVLNQLKLASSTQGEKADTIAFSLKEKPLQIFKLRINQFHKLLLELFLDGHKALDALYEIANHRENVLKILTPKLKWQQRIVKEENAPDRKPDYYRSKLYAEKKVVADYADWVAEGKKKEGNPDSSRLYDQLLNAPLLIRLNDLLSLMHRNKIRSKDRFMWFAVQYLIEFNKLPDWQWAFEPTNRGAVGVSINGEIRKKLYNLEYYSRWPHYGKMQLDAKDEQWKANQMLYKLHLSKDQHVLIKHPRYQGHVFSIGPNVMRILLIKIKEGNLQANEFLHTLARDMERYLTNPDELSALNLLEPKYIPETLTANDPLGFKMEKGPLLRRIALIESKIKDALIVLPQMSRAQVNRGIMRMYTLYTWQPKFLRKNEYNNFSIYHYSLEKIRQTEELLTFEADRQYRQLLQKDLDYFNNLIKESEIGYVGRIPVTLRDHLTHATSLDDLFTRVAGSTIKMLEGWKDLIKTGDLSKFNSIIVQLGFRPGRVSSGPKKSPLPFIIHPGIVLKYFYPGQRLKDINISKNIYGVNMETDPLKEIPYTNEAYRDYISSVNLIPKSVNTKILGMRNRILVHDALLWWIAKQYYTTKCSALEGLHFLPKDAIPGSIPGIGSLREASIDISVANQYDHNKTPVKFREEPDKPTPKMRIKMHQLDDAIFVETASRLYSLVKYFTLSLSHEDVHLESVGFDDLMKTWSSIQNDSLKICQKINETEGEICKAQAIILIEQYGHLRYLGFREVMGLVSSNPQHWDDLNTLRKHVFHMDIPQGTNYKSWVKEGGIVYYLGELDLNPIRKQGNPGGGGGNRNRQQSNDSRSRRNKYHRKS